MLRKWRIYLTGLAVTLFLGACSTVTVAPSPALAPGDVIAVLPMANYTETPEAGQRAASMAFSILRIQNQGGVIQDTSTSRGDPLMGDADPQALTHALDWARKANARYALTGSVQEWRYKVGVDGEPAVGLTFNLIDLSTGETVWSATGSRAGWSRSGLAAVAQTLISRLLQPLHTRAQ